MLRFLAAMEMKPLTLWACQSVAFMISVSVAPLARSIFDNLRRLAAVAGGAGLLCAWRAWLPGRLGSLLWHGGFGLRTWAVFRASGAPFFRVAAFFEGAFSGATCALCAAVVAAFSVVAASTFFMGSNPSCSVTCAASRMTIHRSGWRRKQVKSDPRNWRRTSDDGGSSMAAHQFLKEQTLAVPAHLADDRAQLPCVIPSLPAIRGGIQSMCS